MTELGRYRTADGGLAAYDKNGLTWRIQDQAPEEKAPAEAGIPVPLEYEADPFAGIEEAE